MVDGRSSIVGEEPTISSKTEGNIDAKTSTGEDMTGLAASDTHRRKQIKNIAEC